METKVILRKEAKASGLRRYFTGNSCLHGHIAERQTVNGMCVECSKEMKRKYTASRSGCWTGMAKVDLLTADRARELLTYDPETGVFTWRIRRGRILAGSVAGRITESGYVTICIDGVTHLAHRLAWLIHKGIWPKRQVDHRDTDRGNNQIANLRQATGTQNQGNRRIGSNNTSGAKGVNWNKKSGKWRAVIGTDHVGLFHKFEDAVAARRAAEKAKFGEFARAA